MSIFPDGLGWVATVVFALSYLTKDAAKLRLLQAVAAVLWMSYGLLIHALPVIVANVIVTGMALGSAWRLWSRRTDTA
ncbi:MAG TPA: YgjV family protein [Terriglobia bacterium]|jgi:hypothetical protein|nr:YgjV family protein [Terriglobia bacterium]